MFTSCYGRHWIPIPLQLFWLELEELLFGVRFIPSEPTWSKGMGLLTFDLSQSERREPNDEQIYEFDISRYHVIKPLSIQSFTNQCLASTWCCMTWCMLKHHVRVVRLKSPYAPFCTFNSSATSEGIGDILCYAQLVTTSERSMRKRCPVRCWWKTDDGIMYCVFT